MKKILISLGVIGVISAAVITGTVAYFSDTETSTGNVFTAGAIDLKIDNESYVTNNEGVLVESPGTSWELDDLTDQLFFNFSDLKPGDVGEDTISIHVNDNDAWACMNIAITSTPENGETEPEAIVDDGGEEGELQDELYFAFWADDGDNVYEENEVIFEEGIAGEIFDGTNVALADSQNLNLWGQNGPLHGNSSSEEDVYYIGKVWCYGELEETPLSQQPNGTPLTRGTGFECNGAPVGNISQTDGITADVTFYAEQSRNNSSFLCSQTGRKTLVLENKTSQWDEILGDNIGGTLIYNIAGPEFEYDLQATGLALITPYSLIYAPDPWPQGRGVGGIAGGNTEIASGSTDGSGVLSLSGSVDLGYDLADVNDANAPNAKIWVVLSSDHDGTIMTAWNPAGYLFEHELITYDDTNN